MHRYRIAGNFMCVIRYIHQKDGRKRKILLYAKDDIYMEEMSK